MTRLRYDGLATGASGSLAALTLAADLTNSATTINFNAALTSDGGVAVPTITGSDYIPLSILDPDGNVAEIVYLTAYTSAATSGTISRGQEGTTGVAHVTGVKIVHSPTVEDVGFIGAKVYRSAAYSLVNNAVTSFPWDAEEWDTGGFHDNATNNHRLTVPAGKGGKYSVSAMIQTSVSMTGRIILLARKNGTDVRGLREDFNASGFPGLSSTTDVDLADGDILEVVYYQNSGGTVAVDTATCAFSIHKIG